MNAQKAAEFVRLVSRMTTSTEFEDGTFDPDDSVMTLNELIVSARSIMTHYLTEGK